MKKLNFRNSAGFLEYFLQTFGKFFYIRHFSESLEKNIFAESLQEFAGFPQTFVTLVQIINLKL